MPTAYPVYDPDSGTLVEVDHYSVGEFAAMFHMSPATVRRRIKAGEWTVFEPLPGVYMFTPEQVAEARAGMTHRVEPPPPDLPKAPTRLGVPVDPTDLEGIR
jgi:hypothetical protein